MTLLNLLKYENPTQYYRYKSRIKLCREDLFENNGLFVTQCQFHGNTVSLEFSNTYSKAKHSYNEMRKRELTELTPIKARLELLWLNKQTLCYKTVTETQIDYLNPKSLTFTNLPNVPHAKTIHIKFYFEEDLMCYLEQPLADAKVIK